jgi:hypothetical protein
VFKAIPFKFNPVWRSDKEFFTLVHNLWTDPLYLREPGKQKRLVWKLKDLKKSTKVWQKDFKSLKNARLRVSSRKSPLESKIYRRGPVRI